jgi:cold shock CspA family protein
MTRRTGKLISWHNSYGFLRTGDGEPDCFVHLRSMEDSGCIPLPGRHYSFDIEAPTVGRHPGKPRAINLVRLEADGDEAKQVKAIQMEEAWRSLPMLKPDRARGSGTE